MSSQNLQKHTSEPTESKLASTQRVAKRVDKSDREDDLLTNTQLAKILGVSKVTVNRWRLGQRKPSRKHSNLFNLYEVVDKKWRKI